MKKLSRKEIKSNRLWNHWLYWCNESPVDAELNIIDNYDPNDYRKAFEYFQSNGRNGLTTDELRGIQPLIRAQQVKEITLSSLAEECMEWWAKGWGCAFPAHHTINASPSLDRLTKIAIMRAMKNADSDIYGFFMRHTGISDAIKMRYLAYRIGTLDDKK